MIIGIDVGGTHTDGVLLKAETNQNVKPQNSEDIDTKYKVIRSAKVVTSHKQLLDSITSIIDELLASQPAEEVKRVVLSTTLATNVILEKKYGKIGLILIPGPGLNPEFLKLGEDNLILSAYINHRGKEVSPILPEEVIKGLKRFKEHKINKLAVAGKFSVRNPVQEKGVVEIINQFNYKPEALTTGYSLSGRLNFPRRVISAYYNSAVSTVQGKFVEAVKNALKARNIRAEILLLKSDGGTIPLKDSLTSPVKTVNSGPAASLMGAMALSTAIRKRETAVVLDIGGTTTDIGLFIKGDPVFKPEGIEIEGWPTLVRGLFTISLPIGGDSELRVAEGKLKIGPRRRGPAVAFGGTFPTPTDALLILGELKDEPGSGMGTPFDLESARKALLPLARKLGMGLDIKSLSELIIKAMTEQIAAEIISMLDMLKKRPVYTISELLERPEIKPRFLVAMGGPAKGLASGIAAKLGCQAELISHFELANAVGAAIARPTMTTTVHADTAAGTLNIVEIGEHSVIEEGRDFNIEEAEKLAVEWTRKRAGDKEAVVEITDRESFNLIRGFRSIGEIIEVKAQIKPGPIVGIAAAQESGE